MRIIRTARVLGLGVAAGLLVAGTLTTAAQAAPVMTVDSVTFSAPSITTSGTTMAPQTVTAHVVDPSADPVPPSPNERVWVFILAGTGGKGTLRSMQVTPSFVSGTLADGVWSATVQVPSTADGTWTLAQVYPVCVSSCTPVVPTGAASFTVTGHHRPMLSVGAVPNPVPYAQSRGSVKGRVVDSETGLGMAGVVVGYGYDTSCVQDPAPGDRYSFLVQRTTNAAGYYSFGPVDVARLTCVGIWGSVRRNSDGDFAFPIFRVLRGVPIQPVVTASASAARAKTGTAVAVLGRVLDRGVWDGLGRTVLIQQLHGRTAWRKVATVNVRSNARWNGVVTLTVSGPNVFRALTPAAAVSVESASRPFTITGT
jgi:hypothetical protein